MAARSIAAFVLVGMLACGGGPPPTRSAAGEEDPASPGSAKQPSADLASSIRLEDYPGLLESWPPPVEPQRDPKTGFVVGGKNATELVRSLTEINGRSIEQLEADMRPGAKSDVGSDAGFLGEDERLLEVLATDNAFVVDEHGLTHQELTRPLHDLAAIGMWQLRHGQEDRPFTYRGRRFRIELELSRGTQPSPFRDGTASGTNARLHNLDSDQTLEYALLVPHMIERYGFYEGRGTPYRVEPKQILKTLDFLASKDAPAAAAGQDDPERSEP